MRWTLPRHHRRPLALRRDFDQNRKYHLWSTQRAWHEFTFRESIEELRALTTSTKELERQRDRDLMLQQRRLVINLLQRAVTLAAFSDKQKS